ncbi:FAD binding domain-containing protein [Ophiocordyceps sinensis CO18]|uniref:FAD binding domain-containing protein n=1 Tax=Ophiocordyceps sinensis (strain Co18 / CGMCC 3.14243) TaxID=911162 RepID=T5A763_OPHSC|nr:FAD binding domain-containing protein [Ophiocordyceps sinensis CO18]
MLRQPTSFPRALLLILALVWQVTPSFPGSNASHCKCLPGDECWPSKTEWAAFNATVGGRLVATAPLASPCHYDASAAYDAEECAALKNAWGFPETHYSTSSSPMAAWFANNSCSPFMPPSAPCVADAYVQYAVRAAGVSDYQATLAFATKKKIRLVIRNTGHDYFGKSTGAGALALWTHFLKETPIIKAYSSDSFRGTAMRLGAGVQAFEAYAAADQAGLAVVGGACSTVGVAGGYSQGGGLGPLSSAFGLGADQVLEWEVVLASGQHVVATPTRYKDLYWALSGGGGGPYAAVLSMTVRAHPAVKVASANLTFTDAGVSGQSFTEAVKTFLSTLPRLAEAGTWSSFYVAGSAFRLVPVFGPNLDAATLQALLDPTLAALNKSGISYEYHLETFDTFLSAYDSMVVLENVTEANLGGRLIPRTLLETKDSVASLMEAFQLILDAGGVVSGIVSNQTNFPLNRVENSVNPALRESVISVVFGLPYNHAEYAGNIPLQQEITNTFMPRLEALTPGGGSYLNEGDINQPNWQTAFYGVNYPALRRIKEKYDAHGLFYGLTAVGSEKWEYRMRTDGRLCRVE